MSNTTNPSESELFRWLDGLREGRTQATEKLWDLYFSRMVGLARKKLGLSHRTVVDEEDIALSAFKSFCLGFQAGRIQAPAGADAVNLWPLLVSLTINKAVDHLRREGRLKRGGGKHPVSLVSSSDSHSSFDPWISNEPTPELVAAANDSFDHLLDRLDDAGDETLRIITLESIEGKTPHEIAAQLGCSLRTIQRKLKTIRALWENETA
jgi:DNA-directed RNA polymerase specialized sigma24 family protein